MLDATRGYFPSWRTPLNRQIEKAETRTRRDSARKADAMNSGTTCFDLVPHRRQADRHGCGEFLIAASKPVGAERDAIKTMA